MKKNKIPMRLQPFGNQNNTATEMQPAMPKCGKRPSDIAEILAEKGAKHMPVKDPAQSAKARALRLAALRKQRDATRS